jgi:NitT/TauT family transport system substrate-binding protein
MRPALAGEAVSYLLPASPNQPAFAPWVIAKQLGYYADAGYDVSFAVAQGGIEVARQVASGKAAIGGAISDTPIIVRDSGTRVKAIATLGGGSLTVIVAGRDRGIRALRDLRGKHIMVLSLTDSTYHVLLGALATAGLARGDITIATARPRDIVHSVVTGSADACACVPDWEVEIERAQPGAVPIPTDTVFPSMAQAILASDQTIAAKPAMLRGVVAATLRGMRYIMTDPRTAADAYAQAVPRFRGQEELIAQIFQAYVERTYKGQAIPGQTDANRLAALQRFYLQQHFIKRAVPVTELYTNDFVPPGPTSP